MMRGSSFLAMVSVVWSVIGLGTDSVRAQNTAAPSPALATPASSANSTAQAAQKPVDVYLIGGQSNATGQGYTKNYPQNFKPDGRVLLFHSAMLKGTGPAGVWEPLQPASESPDRFGPEIGFGNRLQELFPGQTIALIKHARSNTNLYAQWSPGDSATDRKDWGPQYTQFVDTVNAGLQALRDQGYHPVIKGMIWLQGEADADKGGAEAEAYAKNLTHFVARVREQFNAPDLIFVYNVINRPPDKGPARDLVIKLQKDASQDSGTPLAIKGAFVVPTDGLEHRADDPGMAANLRNDYEHFGTAGILELGKRMADLMHAHLAPPAPPSSDAGKSSQSSTHP